MIFHGVLGSFFKTIVLGIEKTPPPPTPLRKFPKKSSFFLNTIKSYKFNNLQKVYEVGIFFPDLYIYRTATTVTSLSLMRHSYNHLHILQKKPTFLLGATLMWTKRLRVKFSAEQSNWTQQGHMYMYIYVHFTLLRQVLFGGTL